MNKNDKMKRMKNITLGAIAGYLVGVFTPVAWIGAGISMVSGIILFAMFLYICKMKADEYDEKIGD